VICLDCATDTQNTIEALEIKVSVLTKDMLICFISAIKFLLSQVVNEININCLFSKDLWQGLIHYANILLDKSQHKFVFVMFALYSLCVVCPSLFV
jgi:hypothetical protein